MTTHLLPATARCLAATAAAFSPKPELKMQSPPPAEQMKAAASLHRKVAFTTEGQDAFVKRCVANRVPGEPSALEQYDQNEFNRI